MSDTSIPRRYAALGEERARTWGIPTMLLRAIRSSDRHELVQTLGSADATSPDDWRLLAEDDRVEAVLVCSHDDDTLYAARQLAIRGTPIVIEALPALPGDFVSEMTLYDAEGTSVLKPWFFERPHFRVLCRWLADAGLGSLQSIEYERSIGPDDPNDELMREGPLVWDIDLLRMIGGDYSRVTCMRTGADDQTFLTQSLQLAGEGLPDATLIYRRTTPQGATIRFVGTAGSAELVDARGMFTWSVGGEEVDRTPIMGDIDAVNELYIQELDALWTDATGVPNWRDLDRIFEIREAINRSLRRRRTIDIHHETTSERSQFKTHMATIGCGVILWTMFGIIGLLFAGAVLDPRDKMQQQAEAAGFVVFADEFAAGTAELTPAGQSHLDQIARQMTLNETVVLIETVDAPQTGDSINDDRRLQVWSELSQAGLEDPHRIVVRPLQGTWFSRAMRLARILVFAPVGLFLLIQGLLVITKPAVRSASEPRSA